MQQTLLAVDDEDAVICAIHETLRHCGYRLLKTTDPYHALEMVKTQAPDLLIIDLFMPWMDGATLLKECRRIHARLPVVLTTGSASPQELRRWRTRGELIVAKPWLHEELTGAVEKALERARSAN
jgi:CheY-like chemotaxis protein